MPTSIAPLDGSALDDPTADEVMDGSASLPGDSVIKEARRRFRRCAEWEATAREGFIDDYKFANGDDRNGYQWPNAIRRSRDVSQRPCLTMNIVRQHNLQIVNDGKQNKSAMAVRATGGGASKASADAFSAIIREVEYRSNAQVIYSQAMNYQVTAGIGWWRLSLAYRPGETFDQDLWIDPVPDPLAVYMDPDCKQPDKSDARFGFLFDDVPKDEFAEAYPEFDAAEAAALGAQPFGVSAGDDDWVSRNHIRVAEYWRRVPKRDELLSFVSPQGDRRIIRKSKLPPAVWEELRSDPRTRVRELWDQVVEWKLIVGNKVVDETTWLGSRIPLIPVIGEETVVDGIMDRKGHTRSMRDGQRMYNYNASSQVEFVALQGKSPWVAPAAAIEEVETYWHTANTVAHSVLPWNHLDDEGNPIPPPFKPNPPTAAPAFEAGMQTAFNQLMMVSGQWQNQMGMMGNERTGDAIERRQAQGDTAVYHFFDNLQLALANTCRQIIEIIPKLYDSRRVVLCQAEGEPDFEVAIDPTAKVAWQQEQLADAAAAKRIIFNPRVGEYDVQATSGPAYGTRREATVRAMTLLLTQAPTLVPVIGDLLLSAMDFAEADEAARRLRRLVPPQAMGVGPSPQEQQLVAEGAALRTALAKSLQKQGKLELKLVGKDELRDIDSYEAETKRMGALAKLLPMDSEGLGALIHQLVGDALQTHLVPILQANAGSIDRAGDTGSGGAGAATGG